MLEENKNFTSSPSPKINKKAFLTFLAIFLGLLIAVFVGIYIWDSYLSESARSSRETQKNYEKYLAQETLNMFIEALKKEDVDLASKYFALDTDENSKYYLTRKAWEEELINAKEKGDLGKIIEALSRAVPTPNQEYSQNTFWFSVIDNKGETQQLVEMTMNSNSSVWKIVNI
ncbi:MAG: hypothetical protein UV58_C0020G0003 [Candidatus Wolfebacteria bacterium GW2011_GWC1_43_10]|uniref:DUF4878 domain-containing protein n=1 Tax=Candidatus Wolfebacteria bacterium GW2011_GWC1_43_10 TaxID=1619011 RepID=A0A0G1EEP3_9BACT|nr:MAG: hypothetical protein UV58_C0020G0003 [Candidatus Wolfebacteria bacterium GW2011_GWC1_43_10]